MNCLSQIKITPRDRQVLELLVLGCNNKEVALQLAISPRTVKQHLRTLFLRAGIREGRKRVKLATAMFEWKQRDSLAVTSGDSGGPASHQPAASRPDENQQNEERPGVASRPGKELTHHAAL